MLQETGKKMFSLAGKTIGSFREVLITNGRLCSSPSESSSVLLPRGFPLIWARCQCYEYFWAKGEGWCSCVVCFAFVMAVNRAKKTCYYIQRSAFRRNNQIYSTIHGRRLSQAFEKYIWIHCPRSLALNACFWVTMKSSLESFTFHFDGLCSFYIMVHNTYIIKYKQVAY